MWSEWLARTLNARRAQGGAADLRARKPAFAVVPDLECDGMHPGADEFRSALTKAEADASVP